MLVTWDILHPQVKNSIVSCKRAMFESVNFGTAIYRFWEGSVLFCFTLHTYQYAIQFRGGGIGVAGVAMAAPLFS